jgi:hypothetical protein
VQCKQLSPDEWRKKESELSSKVPAKIDVLNEADSKNLPVWQGMGNVSLLERCNYSSGEGVGFKV